MKTLLFSLTTLLGVTFGNAGITATTSAANIYVEAGASFNTLSTDKGLGIREDSFGYSLLLGAPLGDGDLSFAVSTHDVEDGFEQDWGITYSRAVELFGQNLGATVHLESTDSAFGDRNEFGVGLTYAHSLADLTATVWYEDKSNWAGVEFLLSRDIETPIDNLTVTPFAAVNLADEYIALEAGVAVNYELSNGLSLFAKGSYTNNDLDDSAFAVEDDWSLGAGVNFKF